MTKKQEKFLIRKNIYDNIKAFEKINGEIFEDCKSCEGTGLSGYVKLKKCGYSWGGEFCEVCKGAGKNKIKNEYENVIFVCNSCNGLGFIDDFSYTPCKKCDGVGIIDWARKLTRGSGLKE